MVVFRGQLKHKMELLGSLFVGTLNLSRPTIDESPFTLHELTNHKIIRGKRNRREIERKKDTGNFLLIRKLIEKKLVIKATEIAATCKRCT